MIARWFAGLVSASPLVTASPVDVDCTLDTTEVVGGQSVSLLVRSLVGPIG